MNINVCLGCHQSFGTTAKPLWSYDADGRLLGRAHSSSRCRVQAKRQGGAHTFYGDEDPELARFVMYAYAIMRGDERSVAHAALGLIPVDPPGGFNRILSVKEQPTDDQRGMLDRWRAHEHYAGETDEIVEQYDRLLHDYRTRFPEPITLASLTTQE